MFTLLLSLLMSSSALLQKSEAEESIDAGYTMQWRDLPDPRTDLRLAGMPQTSHPYVYRITLPIKYKHHTLYILGCDHMSPIDVLPIQLLEELYRSRVLINEIFRTHGNPGEVLVSMNAKLYRKLKGKNRIEYKTCTPEQQKSLDGLLTVCASGTGTSRTIESCLIARLVRDGCPLYPLEGVEERIHVILHQKGANDPIKRYHGKVKQFLTENSKLKGNLDRAYPKQRRKISISDIQDYLSDKLLFLGSGHPIVCERDELWQTRYDSLLTKWKDSFCLDPWLICVGYAHVPFLLRYLKTTFDGISIDRFQKGGWHPSEPYIGEFLHYEGFRLVRMW